MRIRGEILDFDGQPAQSPSVSVFIRDNDSSEPVAVHLDRNHFEVWLPVYRGDGHSVRIQAESKDAILRASALHMRPALRKIAVNMQTLSLQPSSRSIIAKVVHDNAPVANAVTNGSVAIVTMQCTTSLSHV